jgi:hypothetical protein
MFDIHRLSVYILLYNKLVTLYTACVCQTYNVTVYVKHITECTLTACVCQTYNVTSLLYNRMYTDSLCMSNI